MKIPNYVIFLDYIDGRIVKYKLTEEDKKEFEDIDACEEDIADFVADMTQVDLMNSNYIFADELKEDCYNFQNNNQN